ncbi:MAG: hypothetical protein B0D91_11150 [Oceanospirillales bacterium LUC14_002_19_P2]|nr:MAG: hypothetical protein B0D91_11150 [Oceanospirillales bacterium LUC14_002_19_P2]
MATIPQFALQAASLIVASDSMFLGYAVVCCKRHEPSGFGEAEVAGYMTSILNKNDKTRIRLSNTGNKLITVQFDRLTIIKNYGQYYAGDICLAQEGVGKPLVTSSNPIGNDDVTNRFSH